MKHNPKPILTENIIQMNDVWASYDSEGYVLKRINLSVRRGSNYAIIGQSGSGKSTMLKLINAMMRPSRGTVKTDYATPDMRSAGFRAMMSKIGYIPQSLGLVRSSSVLENTLIGALPRMGQLQSFLKMYPDGEVSEAERILKLVGLDGKFHRKTHTLSGGEKRRVAIARALMQKPDILLADEIVSELDHSTAVEVMDLIRDAQEKLNLTSVMVHHDIQLALEYANRVAVMRDGEKVLEIGVEGDQIVDFQSGNMTQQEILEMYGDESEK